MKSKRFLILGALLCVVILLVKVALDQPRYPNMDLGVDLDILYAGKPMSRYALDVESALHEMIYKQHLPLDKVRFNTPETLSYLSNPKSGVFHRKGGGLKYHIAPAEWMASGEKGQWVLNGELDVSNYANTDSTTSGDLTLFLIGVSENACRANRWSEKAEDEIPRLNSDQSALYSRNMITTADSDYTLPEGPRPMLDHPNLFRKPIGCFLSYDGSQYVYFHVVHDR